MTDIPETMIGLFVKQLNAKLADEYRNLTIQNKALKQRIDELELKLKEVKNDRDFPS